jgi:hypothetical protein
MLSRETLEVHRRFVWLSVVGYPLYHARMNQVQMLLAILGLQQNALNIQIDGGEGILAARSGLGLPY